jgi:hypothetical protein
MERKKEMLTEVERQRVHVPEEAKVGANVVSDELSADCCGNLWSKFKIPYAENGRTPDTGQQTPEIPNPRFSGAQVRFLEFSFSDNMRSIILFQKGFRFAFMNLKSAEEFSSCYNL